MVGRSAGERLSFKKMLTMAPEELRSLHPDYFSYARAKDIAKLSDEQLFALHPDQIKSLRPIQFADVEPNKLRHLLALLERQVPDEQDIFTVPETDRHGETIQAERYGAKETIRRGIPKAELRMEQERKVEQLRQQDGMITADEMDAKVLAAKFDISLRYLDILGEQGEIRLYKTRGRHMCNVQSVIDYLNRQRVAGAELNDQGKPVMQDAEHYVPVDLEPLTEVPNLYAIEHFAQKLDMDARSFLRNCNLGFYDHYRLGTVLKMSEDDFERSVKRQIAALETRDKTAGRPANVLKA